MYNHYMNESYSSQLLQPSKPRHQGPPLLLPALVYAALLAAGAAKLTQAFAVPHNSAPAAIAFLAEHSSTIRWGSFFEFASAIPLGIFAATTYSRLGYLGVRAAGKVIALCGGVAAMMMLLISALSSWNLTRPGMGESDGAIRAFQAFAFDGGGPGFAVPFGLFIAGVSLSAGLYRLIPRWVMWFGIVIAIACELASFTLVNFNAGYCIPIGRFLGVVWMVALAFTLPTRTSSSQATAQA